VDSGDGGVSGRMERGNYSKCAMEWPARRRAGSEITFIGSVHAPKRNRHSLRVKAQIPEPSGTATRRPSQVLSAAWVGQSQILGAHWDHEPLGVGDDVRSLRYLPRLIRDSLRRLLPWFMGRDALPRVRLDSGGRDSLSSSATHRAALHGSPERPRYNAALPVRSPERPCRGPPFCFFPFRQTCLVTG
jgi:hypothetical protein